MHSRVCERFFTCAYVIKSNMGAQYMQALSCTHTHTYVCTQDRILESRLHKEQKQQKPTTRSDSGVGVDDDVRQ